jgi:putative tryptophan/tyrosine transport system substrate-binding protein
VGLLINQNNPSAQRQIANAQEAARGLGLQLLVLNATTVGEIDKCFEAFVEHRAGALLIGADPFFGNRVAQLVALAARHRIPTMYFGRGFTEAGGLMSYGASQMDAWRQVGVYIARILKGAKPAELPAMQSTKFEFVINFKTANSLGLDVPPGLSARADEVIE